MQEIHHVPAREAISWYFMTIGVVVVSEQLHAHYSKDEDNDGQDKCQVAEGTHRIVYDFDQHV